MKSKKKFLKISKNYYHLSVESLPTIFNTQNKNLLHCSNSQSVIHEMQLFLNISSLFQFFCKEKEKQKRNKHMFYDQKHTYKLLLMP